MLNFNNYGLNVETIITATATSAMSTRISVVMQNAAKEAVAKAAVTPIAIVD